MLIKGSVLLVDMLHVLVKFEGPTENTMVIIDTTLESLESIKKIKVDLMASLQQ